MKDGKWPLTLSALRLKLHSDQLSESLGGYMRSAGRCRAGFGALFCLIFLFSPLLAHGKNGRDFAGFYDVKDATDLGSEVQLTLLLRLFNYSDAEVADATLTLRDSLLRQKSYGSFPSVSVGDRQSVRLSGGFTIPHREYERWQRGAVPNLIIEFKDAAGKSIRRRIELVKMPLGEKE